MENTKKIIFREKKTPFMEPGFRFWVSCRRYPVLNFGLGKHFGPVHSTIVSVTIQNESRYGTIGRYSRYGTIGRYSRYGTISNKSKFKSAVANSIQILDMLC